MLTFLRGPFNVIVFVNWRTVGAYATDDIRQAREWFYAGLPFSG